MDSQRAIAQQMCHHRPHLRRRRRRPRQRLPRRVIPVKTRQIKTTLTTLQIHRQKEAKEVVVDHRHQVIEILLVRRRPGVIINSKNVMILSWSRTIFQILLQQLLMLLALQEKRPPQTKLRSQQPR